MEKFRDWIDIGLRATIGYLIPISFILYVILEVTFNIELYNLFEKSFILFLIALSSYLVPLIKRYQYHKAGIYLPTFEGVKKTLNENRWEVLVLHNNEMIVRPRFDFPNRIVLNSKISAEYRQDRLEFAGPYYYVDQLITDLGGDTSDRDKKKEKGWYKSTFGAVAFAIIFPSILNGGMLWEIKRLYHNNFVEAETIVEMPEDQIIGNSVENINNGSFAVANDRYIFYVEEGYQIKKAKQELRDSQTLVTAEKNREIEELNLVGDWLYYTEQDFIEDKAALKRMNLENEKSETLYMMGGATQLHIYDNWIYFINAEDESSLYKMDLNGNDVQSVHAEFTTDLAVYNNQLIISSFEEERDLKTIIRDTPGNYHSTIMNEEMRDLVKWADYYYYIGENEGLYRIKTTLESEPEVLVEHNISNFTITKQGIFYSLYRRSSMYLEEDNGVYQMDLEGKERKLVYKVNDTVEIAKVNGDLLFRATGEYGYEDIKWYELGTDQ